jgi:hypothetical protein
MEFWEQQEGESAADYARFLIYRNLGPARTIDAAYEIYQRDNQPEPNSSEKGLSKPLKVSESTSKRAGGWWKDTYFKHNWRKRAEAWDIHNLTLQGKEFVQSFYQAITGLSLLTSQSILEGKIKPDNWADLLNGLTTLGNFISPEALTAFYGGFGAGASNSGLSPGTDNQQDGAIGTSTTTETTKAE